MQIGKTSLYTLSSNKCRGQCVYVSDLFPLCLIELARIQLNESIPPAEKYIIFNPIHFETCARPIKIPYLHMLRRQYKNYKTLMQSRIKVNYYSSFFASHYKCELA